MRLGQMARKLGISQGEITRYLSGQNMVIEEGSNVKLEEQHVRALYARFAPALNAEPTLKERDAPPAPGPSAPAEPIMTESADFRPQPGALNSQPVVPPAPEANIADEPVAGTIDENKGETPLPSGEASDIIRAPKVELAGLKVIGKIDLPGPKKKDPPPPPEDSAAPSEENAADSTAVAIPQNTVSDRGNEVSKVRDEGSRERLRRDDGQTEDQRSRGRSKTPREQRPRKNPISVQREREIEAERLRRQEKAAQEKERRTQNYHKRVTHSPPTKAVRLIDDQVEHFDATSFAEEPTTWFGKLVKWLRG